LDAIGAVRGRPGSIRGRLRFSWQSGFPALVRLSAFVRVSEIPRCARNDRAVCL